MQQGDLNLSRIRKWILDLVVEDHMTLPEAARSFQRNLSVDPSMVEAALAQLISDSASNQAFDNSITDRTTYGPGTSWYLPAMAAKQWQSYLSHLRAAHSPNLDVLDAETDRIMHLLANPHRPGQKRKGLVMGNVQSGKTRNYAGVIAKAADAGYRCIIVLAGMHNNLREQTQTRLDRDVFRQGDWYRLTSETLDIEHEKNPRVVFQKQDLICAVVKKNIKRLVHLTAILSSLGPDLRRNRPILIIDDEADQASPNSLAEKRQISAINGQLRTLWELVQSGTYLAYTATPFANVLIDPDETDDLFPSDFITTIEPGEGYFGPERVFGLATDAANDDESDEDGLDMVRIIVQEDADRLKPPTSAGKRACFNPEIPNSLREAVAWFVVATAISRARGRHANSSMLVHTTHYASPHFALQKRIRALTKDWEDRACHGDLAEFQLSWEQEARRLAELAPTSLPDWTPVRAEICKVLEDVDVLVDNGSSEDRLNYGTDPRTVIAVGGGTLSRGLTLEGLVVSYFTRTSNAYDTLLQMGRWFGYRKGYEDLPRVWVAEGLDRDYSFLATVEKELREEICALQGSEYSPEQVGVRIRQHPGRLQITASNKMYAAKEVQLGLSGTSNQTFILDGSQNAFLANRNAVEHLLDGRRPEPVPHSPNRFWTKGISGDRVLSFLDEFHAHRDQTWLEDNTNRDALKRWVRRYANGPIWNVVMVSGRDRFAKDGMTPLGSTTIAGIALQNLDRSPLANSTSERLDFKAIMSANDRLADIPPAAYAETLPITTADRLRIRRRHGKGQGLIVIYPISQNSKADPTRSADRLPTRIDMPITHDLIGFAIFFPTVADEVGSSSYVSVRTTWDVPDTVEGDEEINMTEQES